MPDHSDASSLSHSANSAEIRQFRPSTAHFSAREIIRGLSKGRWHSNHGVACCPAHNDETPSLHVTEKNGRVLFHCWSGCSQDEVLASLRRLGLWPEARDEHDESPRPKPRPRRVEPEPDKNSAGYARAIWSKAVPIAGTLAERYLREHREITGPLPDTLRFSHGVKHAEVGRYLPALIVPVFDGAGELRRVQAVFLDRDTGAKAPVPNPKKDGKKTFGRGASTIPALFRGRKPGRRFDVILTEGPEDAVALWSVLEAEGGDVAAALGNKVLHKPEFAPGTRLLLVADNDAPGARAAQNAAAEHTMRGCEVWTAVPPTDIKDANALLQERGADAVRAMIDAAERFQPAPAEGAAVAALDAAEASERTRQAIARFFREALAWEPPETDAPGDSLDYNELRTPVHGVRATLGAGKSAAVLEQLTDPALAGHHLNYYVPAHRLGAELLERFQRLAGPDAPHARIVLGREQTLPSGEPMCRKAETAKALAATGRPVQTHLCAQPGNDLLSERCPHYGSCAYQAQLADRSPGIRLLSHAHAFQDHPKPDIAIFDESFWAGSLRGVEGRGVSSALWRLREIRDVPRRKGTGRDDDATADLASISARCVRAIDAGGTLADYVAASVTEADAQTAMALEFRRVAPLGVTPAMPEAVQKARIDAYESQEARRLATYFRLLARCLAAGVDPSCFELRTVKNGDGAPEPRLFMYWRATMKIGNVPTLLIDANLEREIAECFFPAIEEPTIIDAELQSYRAVQITDRRVSKSMLSPEPKGDDDPEWKRQENRRFSHTRQC